MQKHVKDLRGIGRIEKDQISPISVSDMPRMSAAVFRLKAIFANGLHVGVGGTTPRIHVGDQGARRSVGFDDKGGTQVSSIGKPGQIRAYRSSGRKSKLVQGLC